ncbi:hypothetical protein THAOC_01938, partial [Thalassiosira oceanica]
MTALSGSGGLFSSRKKVRGARARGGARSAEEHRLRLCIFELDGCRADCFTSASPGSSSPTMARTKEEREQRRLDAKKRSEARKAAKLQAKQGGAGGSGSGNDASSATSASSASDAKVDLRSSLPASTEHNASLPLVRLPTDALGRVARFLPARELGAVGLTCSGLNSAVGASRV